VCVQIIIHPIFETLLLLVLEVRVLYHHAHPAVLQIIVLHLNTAPAKEDVKSLCLGMVTIIQTYISILAGKLVSEQAELMEPGVLGAVGAYVSGGVVMALEAEPEGVIIPPLLVVVNIAKETMK